MAGVNIPQPSQPVIDFKTGLITREWYRFFVNPSFQSLNISGVLGVASGGTSLSSGTAGGVLYFPTSTSIGSSGVLASNGLVFGGGSGGALSTMTALTNGQLVVGQTGAAPLGKTMSGDAVMAASGAMTITSLAVTTTKIAANAVTNAKLAQMSASTIKGNNTGGASDTLDMTVAQTLSLLGALSKVKVGNFSRDIATATGSQVVTGVGFTPRLLVFTGGVNGTAKVSLTGFTDGTTHAVTFDNGNASADTYGASATQDLYFVASGSDYTSGIVSSLDSDGFTISWIKTGSPTGTATISYIALG